jgi:hypothetical protein
MAGRICMCIWILTPWRAAFSVDLTFRRPRGRTSFAIVVLFPTQALDIVLLMGFQRLGTVRIQHLPTDPALLSGQGWTFAAHGS